MFVHFEMNTYIHFIIKLNIWLFWFFKNWRIFQLQEVLQFQHFLHRFSFPLSITITVTKFHENLIFVFVFPASSSTLIDFDSKYRNTFNCHVEIWREIVHLPEQGKFDLNPLCSHGIKTQHLKSNGEKMAQKTCLISCCCC